MALVKFELHHKHKSGTRQIRISYVCADGRYRENTHETVREGNWDFDRCRCKRSARDAGIINHELDEQEKRLNAAVREIRASSRRVTVAALRAKIKGRAGDFWEYYEKFLVSPPQSVGPETLAKYKSLKGILKEFEKDFGELEFRAFDQQLINEFTLFMRTKEYDENTIKLYFTKIRALLNHAVDANVIESAPKLKNVAKGIRAAVVYLTVQEVEKVYKRIQLPFKTTKNKRILKMIGEIFVLGTQIGVRVSDLKIKPENISTVKGQKFLNLSNKKTVGQVIIPISKLAIEILEKYNWQIPKFSRKTMNEHIGFICEQSGIKETVVSRSVKGGKMIEKTLRKWEMVHSHTMRRTFATNAFLAGVPVPVIMKITGHTTIESFMKYIAIGNQEAAEIMAKHMKM